MAYKYTPDPKYVSFYYEKAEFPMDITLDPKSTAILFIDIQNEFCSREIGEAAEFKAAGDWERWIPFHDRIDNIMIPNCVKLRKYFRDNGMFVTYGRIACNLETGEDRCMVQKSEGWNGMLLPVGSYNAEFVEQLTPGKNELVVNKTTDSVLAGTNYARLIRNMGIKTVVVCGMVTDQCVAGTVRELADEDFQVIIAEDACSAATQELHDAELKIMNIIYGSVMSSDQVIDCIEANK